VKARAAENARLLAELEAKKGELAAALDTRTATADILHAISRSPTDLQPVFDAIVASAVHLLHGFTGTLTRIEGDQIALAAMVATDESVDAMTRAAFPRLPDRGQGLDVYVHHPHRRAGPLTH
jgi:hypothetical protein